MRVTAKTLITMVLLVAVFAIGGCGETETTPDSSIEPKVKPPVVAKAGTLRAGVDLKYPPFAGVDNGREAGIDVDVASALANELGLTLELVEVDPSQVATALADGTVDIMMSAPLKHDAVLGAAISGIYLADGPAIFVKDSAEPSGTSESTGTADTSAAVEPVPISTIVGKKVGAQLGSESFWLLSYEIGESEVATFTTLREAFDALDKGDIEVVAADALVGAYIARDFEGIEFGGLIGEATPLGVAVALENVELDAAVRDALDVLAANGTLGRVRTTWVGDLPQFAVFGSESIEDAVTP
ncbi:MAG: substrate-binding periplasmic protein [Coriobacteriia bacterium]